MTGGADRAALRPRAVLFDWDNTLADNWACVHDALNAALVAMGHAPWTFAETRDRVRRSMRESFPDLFGARWTEARDIFYARFAAAHLDHLQPMPGAAALLDALGAAGVYLAVVSNKTGRFLRREVGALGWTDRFGAVVGAGDAAADKPDPAPVTAALAPIGLAPGGFAREQVWFVGDADIDLECAHRSGCLPVFLAPRDAGAPDDSPPVHWLDDCDGLRDLVRRLFDPISPEAGGLR